MRVITLNVNGIRAAERKGFARWLARVEPWDVVCLQELKAHHDDVPRSLRAPRKCASHFHPAEKKGYAGVGIYARKPATFSTGFGQAEFDREGRYLEAHFRDLTVISVYLPSGSSGPHRQASKFRFLDAFLPHLRKLKRSGREVILCGDWNIAHQAIDLKNWRSNQKNSGFLPEERAWLTRVFDEAGFVDVFRRYYGPTLKAFEAVGEAGAAALRDDLVALVRRFDRNRGGPVAIPSQYTVALATRS